MEDSESTPSYTGAVLADYGGGYAAELLAEASVAGVCGLIHDRLDALLAGGKLPHRVRVPPARVREVLQYLADGGASQGKGLRPDEIRAMAVQTTCRQIEDEFQPPPTWDPNRRRYDPATDIQRVANSENYHIKRNTRQPMGYLRY
jgi:hypothetical protein